LLRCAAAANEVGRKSACLRQGIEACQPEVSPVRGVEDGGNSAGVSDWDEQPRLKGSGLLWVKGSGLLWVKGSGLLWVKGSGLLWCTAAGGSAACWRCCCCCCCRSFSFCFFSLACIAPIAAACDV
jgi:hypothetical protein